MTYGSSTHCHQRHVYRPPLSREPESFHAPIEVRLPLRWRRISDALSRVALSSARSGCLRDSGAVAPSADGRLPFHHSPARPSSGCPENSCARHDGQPDSCQPSLSAWRCSEAGPRSAENRPAVRSLPARLLREHRVQTVDRSRHRHLPHGAFWSVLRARRRAKLLLRD